MIIPITAETGRRLTLETVANVRDTVETVRRLIPERPWTSSSGYYGHQDIEQLIAALDQVAQVASGQLKF